VHAQFASVHHGTDVVKGYCGFSYATKTKSEFSECALLKGMWQKHSEVRRLLHIAASRIFRINNQRLPSFGGARCRLLSVVLGN